MKMMFNNQTMNYNGYTPSASAGSRLVKFKEYNNNNKS